ncbi:hypothetical protein AQ912_10205 [Burkholderia pseudomallei]|nr:hypothetical protein AQ811_02570 [Burkholderia pseudomallei]ONC21565.1 hypothetical protein AQ912_10205 [Burkholderia pseudomallei]ONC53175.1 hypothetical protein AQ918_11605 [Burkholderia pseudomallei]
MRRLGLGWAQLATGIDASRQQIVQQALLDGLKLGDDRLGFVDGGVEGVKNICDFRLLAETWAKHLQRAQMLP